MRKASQAFGLWFLLVLAWNDAILASSEGSPSELSATRGKATAELRHELRAHERTAVQRDLHDLHLLDDVLADQQSRHAPDATTVGESESIDLTNADEPLPDGSNPALEDRSAFEHRAATTDPFLPAEKLIKSEENATAMGSFKGPHADVSREIHRVAKNTNKEVFGGANEAKVKMKRIKKDTEKLQKVAIREAKELGVEVPKPGAKAKAKKKNQNPWDVEAYAEMTSKPSDKPKPKINFSGAGSGAAPKSGLYQHDKGNVMDKGSPSDYKMPTHRDLGAAVSEMSNEEPAEHALRETKHKVESMVKQHTEQAPGQQGRDEGRH